MPVAGNPSAAARVKNAADLLTAPIKVVNVGLESFSQQLTSIGVPVVHVSWRPPANGDPKLADLVSKMGA